MSPAVPLLLVAAVGQTFTLTHEDAGPEPATEAAPAAAQGATSEAPPAFQGALFRGAWRAQAAADTAHEDRCDDKRCEDVFDLRNRLDLRLESDVGPGLRAVVEARFDHYVVGERPDGRAFTLLNAERVKGVFGAEVRDAYVQWRGLGAGGGGGDGGGAGDGPALDLTVGQQVVAWGVLDAASAQDVLNPVDYRGGLAPGGEPPRVPVFAARAEGRLGPVTLDGVVAPFFTPHRFDLVGSDFAPLGAAGGAALGGDLGALFLGALDESVEDDWSRTMQATRVPMDLPQGADAGLRLGGSLAGFDLHAAYLYVWDRIPQMRDRGLAAVAEGGLPFESTYARRHVFGVDATFAAGDFVFRLESGWSPKRTVMEVGEGGRPEPARRSAALSGAGVDWTWDTDLMASVEVFWMAVLDVPAGRRLYLLDPDLFGAAGGLTVRFWDDDLAVSPRAMVTSLGDLIAFPEVSWRFADGHELAASVQVYEPLDLGAPKAEGDPPSIAEQFDHNDQAVVRYVRTF